MTMLAFSFCDLQLWHIVLAWLLPFILGLLLGYAIWAKYKKEKEDIEKKMIKLQSEIDQLGKDVDECRHDKTGQDSEIASLKGRLRERSLQVSTLEASLAAASKKGKGKDEKSAKGSTHPIKNDLKKIEGIGPKIEDILNVAGIFAFSQLASASKSSIRSILDKAGGQFGMADPETWSKQADLAANGNWDALKKLQDNLKGGKSG